MASKRKQINTKKELQDFIKTAAERDEARPKNGEPGLFFLRLKHGGAWRLRFTDVAGQRRTATIADHNTSPADANSIAASWKSDIKKGIDPFTVKEQAAQEKRQAEQTQKKRHHLLVRAFFEEIYMPSLEQHAGKAAARNTRNIIKKDFGHLFDRDMDGLTVHDIRAWENDRKAQGITRATLQRNYSAFKAMINFAAGIKKGHVNDTPILEDNPIKDVHLTQPSAEEKRAEEEHEQQLKQVRDVLSDDVRQKLASGLAQFDQSKRDGRRSSRQHGKAHLPDLDGVAFAHWFVPFTHIARLTGMRPGDILTLRWQNVQTHIRTRGPVLTFKPNKTRHHKNPVEVNIPLSGELLKVIDAWREQQGNPKTGYLFTSKGDHPLDKKAYHRHWTEVKKLAEVDPSLDFYSFRHHFISDLVARGWPLLRIAKLVGHRDGAMIAAHYYHDDTDDLGQSLADIGESWGFQNAEGARA